MNSSSMPWPTSGSLRVSSDSSATDPSAMLLKSSPPPFAKVHPRRVPCGAPASSRPTRCSSRARRAPSARAPRAPRARSARPRSQPNARRPSSWPARPASSSTPSARGIVNVPLSSSAGRPSSASARKIAASVSRICAGRRAPRASRQKTSGGPFSDVDVPSAPARDAGDRHVPRPRRARRASARRLRTRSASPASTASATSTDSGCSGTSRSASTPSAMPGSDHATSATASRTSTCGRRRSVASVRLLSRIATMKPAVTASRGPSSANRIGAETSAKPKPVADCSAAPSEQRQRGARRPSRARVARTQQRAARHLRRLRDAEQLERRRRDVREDPAARDRARAPSTVTTIGTGFSECAVFGEPSGSSMWSALPWSAVTMHAPPVACTASTTRARHASTVSIAVTAAGITPVWPTMSGLAKLMTANVKSSSAHARDERVGRLERAHLRLVVVRRHVARRGHELAPLALLRALLAAAEEVRHVRVLLGLGDVQLAAAAVGDDARQRHRRALRDERDRVRRRRARRTPSASCSARPAAAPRRSMPGHVRRGQRAAQLAHAVGAEVERDDRVAGPDRALGADARRARRTRRSRRARRRRARASTAGRRRVLGERRGRTGRRRAARAPSGCRGPSRSSAR